MTSDWVQPARGEGEPIYVVDSSQDGPAAVDHYYRVGLWRLQHLSHTPSTQVIFIAQLEGSVLVAVPSSVWHKQRSVRILPPNALSKPQCLEVLCCGVMEREVPVEGLAQQIWVGYLRQEFVQVVDFNAEEINVEYVFEAECEGATLPAAQALHDAARDHFSFFSASEGPHPLETMDGVGTESEVAPAGGGEERSSAGVSSRISKLETMMEQLMKNVDVLASQASPGSRPSALKTPARKSSSAQSPKRVTVNPTPKVVPQKAGQ